MGQEYSRPKKGAELRVIGAGMPRTGTASFSRALETLLDGPVYHGGTQVTLGREVEIKSWIRLLSQWPAMNATAQKENLELLRGRTEGYVAITDSPGLSLVPELMELYPDAKVVCTVRDVDAWEKSMATISNTATMWFLRFVLFLTPSMRHFVDYVRGLQHQWTALYGEAEPPPTRISYLRHMEWLRETVPPEKLVLVDVKDGWEPLCAALGVPVPEGVPFPRINDSQAIEEFAKKQVLRGLGRWAAVLSVGGLGVAWMRSSWWS